MRRLLIALILLSLVAPAWAGPGMIGVKDYGAKGDCATDDTAAIQAAINAAVATGGGQDILPPRDVFFPTTPNSCYLTSFPIWVKANSGGSGTGLHIHGAGREAAVVKASGNYDVMFVAPPTWTSQLNAGSGAGVLWSNSGLPVTCSTCQEMLFDSSNAPWALDLKSAFGNATPFNGLSQFSIEFWAKVTDTNNGDGGYWLDASGSDGTAVNNARATGVAGISYTVASGGSANTISISLNTATTHYLVTNFGSFTSNAWHYFEMSYDGSNIRTFIDGVEANKTAATGSTVDLAYTPLMLDALGATPIGEGSGVKGQMFGLRVSNIARHTADTSYTPPTTQLSGDSNTLLLLNGTTVDSAKNTASSSGPFVQPEYVNGSANTSAWYTMLVNYAGTNQKVTIDDLQLNNGAIGLDVGLTLDSTFKQLLLNGNTFVGLRETNNSYGDRWNDIRVSNGGNAQAAFEFLWGLQWAADLRADAGAGAYAVIGWDTIHLIDPFLQMNSNTLCGIVLRQAVSSTDTSVIDNPTLDDENGSTGPSLCVVGAENITVNGGGLSGYTSTSPIVFDTGNFVQGIILKGTQLTSVGGNPSQWSKVSFSPPQEQNAYIDFDNVTFSNRTGLLQNAIALTDGNINYRVEAPPQRVNGTTAGNFIWSIPIYSSGSKCVVVSLNGYENTTSTAQTATLPPGISSLGAVTTDAGTCTGVTITATTITLPSSMSGTQTGACRACGE